MEEKEKKPNVENEQIKELSQEAMDKVAGGDMWDFLGECGLIASSTVPESLEEGEKITQMLASHDFWGLAEKFGKDGKPKF